MSHKAQSIDQPGLCPEKLDSLFLRNTYKIANSVRTATTALILWCEKAEASAVSCLKQMAKTIYSETRVAEI